MGSLLQNVNHNEGGTHLKANGHASGPVPQFVLVQPSSMDALIRLLEARLPKSANVYNCALRLSRAPGEFEMFTFDGNLSADAWVLSKFPHQCLGAPQMFIISAPNLPSPAFVPVEVRQAFIETPVINWNQHYDFIGLDHAVGSLITDVATFAKGNLLRSHPHFYYTMPREEALQLEAPSFEEGHTRVRVKQLDTGAGADFIAATWKYTGEKTLDYVRAMIDKHPSVGVYVNGVPVSGVITHAEILVGMLGTHPDHRNKGYALVCMKTLLRKLALEGYVPGSGVERFNVASQKFHEKVGMRISHKTVDINNIGF